MKKTESVSAQEPEPRCQFCGLYHNPEKTHCNNPLTGEITRRAGPVKDSAQEPEEWRGPDIAHLIHCYGHAGLASKINSALSSLREKIKALGEKEAVSDSVRTVPQKALEDILATPPRLDYDHTKITPDL